MIDKLLEMCHKGKLHQCGSRYFAAIGPSYVQVGEDTDYDFFCGIEMKDELLALGLRVVIDRGGDLYELMDNDAAAILVSDDIKVQVVLRFNPALYNKMHTSISPEFYRDYLWKSGNSRPERKQIRAIINQLLASVRHAQLSEQSNF